MKIEERYGVMVLTADDDKMLCRKKEYEYGNPFYLKEVWLGKSESPDDYMEVILLQQESQENNQEKTDEVTNKSLEEDVKSEVLSDMDEIVEEQRNKEE